MDAIKKAKDGQETQLETQDINLQELKQMTVEAIMHGTDPMDHRQNMIEYYNNCSICGSELDFTHVTQFQYSEVKVEGHCPCCNVQLKNETHRLQ